MESNAMESSGKMKVDFFLQYLLDLTPYGEFCSHNFNGSVTVTDYQRTEDWLGSEVKTALQKFDWKRRGKIASTGVWKGWMDEW